MLCNRLNLMAFNLILGLFTFYKQFFYLYPFAGSVSRNFVTAFQRYVKCWFSSWLKVLCSKHGTKNLLQHPVHWRRCKRKCIFKGLWKRQLYIKHSLHLLSQQSMTSIVMRFCRSRNKSISWNEIHNQKRGGGHMLGSNVFSSRWLAAILLLFN